jgi:RimJ/RimL family protein N-acetyltransferase
MDTNPAIETRLLTPEDRILLDAFLAAHPSTTMFMRSNLRASGMSSSPTSRYEAIYAGCFDADGELVSAVSHNWNGMLLVAGERGLAAAASTAVRASDLDITGISGPWSSVEACRVSLGLAEAATTLDAPERLYELELDVLRVPELLERASIDCRPPSEDQFDLLYSWRLAYQKWLGGPLDDEARGQLETGLREKLDDESCRVLTVDDEPVSYTAFNATLPEQVQIGGVWTPPEHRGNGYARCVVAGHLLDARKDGVARAILFTAEDNAAAQTAYEAIGFETSGRYGLVLFDERQSIDD